MTSVERKEREDWVQIEICEEERGRKRGRGEGNEEENLNPSRIYTTRNICS
jgi:hypothetical protein